ncbi:hypothetical protein D6745_04535 [Candidatus Woesearchaeota archaeon]|nr:MAG: hypothetical protein D6745_04535 [Candidatus Woesearchaeota archaeon]
MGRVTDTITKRVRKHLTEILLDSHSSSERSSRSGLAIQHVNFRWSYANDWDVAARNGMTLGEKRSSSSEWVCQEGITVCLYDPENPELGFGIGHAAHAAPLDISANSNGRELDEINFLLRIACFRAAQDYDLQKHFRARAPWMKPQTFGPTPNVNFEDVRRGMRRQKAWESAYFSLAKIVRKLTAQIRDLDPEWETIAGSFASGHVYNAHVRQVVVEVNSDKLGSESVNRRHLTTKMIHKWDQFGIISLYAQYLRDSIPDQVVRAHAPLIYPKDVNFRLLMANYFDRFIKNVDAFRLAEALEPGTYLSLLRPAAASTYFHESLYAHGIDGEEFINDRLASLGRIGQKLSDYPFNVWVFGAQSRKHGGFGTSLFDDEGTPVKEVQVVSDGKLHNLLHSRRSAAYFETEPMGNMRMEYGTPRDAFFEFMYPFSSATLATVPQPRTSFVSIEASEGYSYPEDKLRVIARRIARQRGRSSKYLEVIDINGGYTQTDEGVWVGISPFILLHDVRKNTVTPVRDVDIRSTLSGSLSGLIGLGEEAEYVYGICGSESGEVPETVSVPSALVDNITYVKHLEPIPPIPFPNSEDLDAFYDRKKSRVKF